MTDQIKPASEPTLDSEITTYFCMVSPEYEDGEMWDGKFVRRMAARIDELKAQLAAQEQSHKAMLQTVGEEATRQIAELQIQPSVGSDRVWVGADHRCRHSVALNHVSHIEEALEEQIAEKDKRIAELEAVLSGGAK